MTKHEAFEIRIAVIGYVSMGKSTVINALLGDKFSEVSMQRTTAGVNYFRIVSTETKENIVGEEEQPGKKQCTALNDVSNLWTAEATHSETCKDNKTLRGSDVVVERFFNIQVDEPLCDMRDDTYLVLVDIPGINEAGSSKKFEEYVAEKWNTFDCVIVVMDAVQGVNTEEQVDLLKFVNTNNETKKRIPTIMLGNKMDDPNHEEKIKLVHETRKKAIEIFGLSCSDEGLQALLAPTMDTVVGHRSDAVFIPISAINAYIYRKAGNLTLESFQTLDKDLVDEIGKAEVGRRWRTMSDEQKCEVVRSVTSNPSEYQDRIEGTNFDKFVSIFKFFLGGADTQNAVIAKQITVGLASLTHGGVAGRISDDIRDVYARCVAVNRSTEDLKEHFWRVYTRWEDQVYNTFKSTVDPRVLSPLMVELEQYHALATSLVWDFEQVEAIRRMKEIVGRQLSILLQEQEKWSFKTFYKYTFVTEGMAFWCEGCKGKNTRECLNQVDVPIGGKQEQFICGQTRNIQYWKKHKKLKWANLAPYDWMTILSSILIPSNEIEFYQDFSPQKAQLEEKVMELRIGYAMHWPSLQNDLGECSKYLRESLRHETTKASVKDAVIRMKIPEKMSDPSHWGHVAWKYVSFCRSLK